MIRTACDSQSSNYDSIVWYSGTPLRVALSIRVDRLRIRHLYKRMHRSFKRGTTVHRRVSGLRWIRRRSRRHPSIKHRRRLRRRPLRYLRRPYTKVAPISRWLRRRWRRSLYLRLDPTTVVWPGVVLNSGPTIFLRRFCRNLCCGPQQRPPRNNHPWRLVRRSVDRQCINP